MIFGTDLLNQNFWTTLYFCCFSFVFRGVTWVVQNDATDPSAASNCKQNIPAGNDCYEWNVDTKKGTAKWAWKAGMTSGGMIGPLPSYDFCAVLKKGDVSGIDDYEVSCIFFFFSVFLFFLSCSLSSFFLSMCIRSLVSTVVHCRWYKLRQNGTTALWCHWSSAWLWWF